MAEITREEAAALADAICSTALVNVTLRDFFAAFALAGMLANSGYHFDGAEDDEERAAQAYSFADSMLAQRKEEE